MKPAGAIVGGVLLACICLFITRANGYQLYVIALVGLTTIVALVSMCWSECPARSRLATRHSMPSGRTWWGFSQRRSIGRWWAALPLAALVAGAAGLVLALPRFRVRGPYLAMVTIAFGFVVEQGAAEWSGVTGGWNGLLAFRCRAWRDLPSRNARWLSLSSLAPSRRFFSTRG